MARFFDGFELAALACLVGLGLLRAVFLYRRGVRVVVIDRTRSPARALLDLLAVLCFLLWGYEVVAHAWPLENHSLPFSLGRSLFDVVSVAAMGATLVVAGLGVYASSLFGLGDSWRLGIDRESPGGLVTDGIYSWTRNPIYVGLDLVVVGMFLLEGRLIFLVLALAILLLLHDQVRIEEEFLEETFGSDYRDYRARVGRYLGVFTPRRK